MTDDKKDTKDTSKPPEKSKAQLAKEAWEAAQLEEQTGPQKAQFMAWMDEWAEKRSKDAPKPKTATGEQRPKSFFEGLFGDSA